MVLVSDSHQFRFTVEEWPPANYAAISANIAVSGIKGGHEKYVMFLKYGSPPTFAKYDYRSVVTASDSYTGDKLYSQDIRIEQPFPGFVSLSSACNYECLHEIMGKFILN